MFTVAQLHAAPQHHNAQKAQCQVLVVYVLVMPISLAIVVEAVCKAVLFGQGILLVHKYVRQ